MFSEKPVRLILLAGVVLGLVYVVVGPLKEQNDLSRSSALESSEDLEWHGCAKEVRRAIETDNSGRIPLSSSAVYGSLDPSGKPTLDALKPDNVAASLFSATNMQVTALTASRVAMTFPDNTVVIADAAKQCQIAGLYHPTLSGDIHPGVSEDIRRTLDESTTPEKEHKDDTDLEEEEKDPRRDVPEWKACAEEIGEALDTRFMAMMIRDDAVTHSTGEDDGKKVREMIKIDKYAALARREHKVAPLNNGKSMAFLFPDNTVVTADTETCTVTNAYLPDENQEIHPDVRKAVHSNMHLARDSKKKSTVRIRPVGFPCISPATTFWLMRLAYRKDHEFAGYIRRHLRGFRIVSSKKANGFRALAVLDSNGNLFYTFRGVNGFHSGLSAVSGIGLALARRTYSRWMFSLRGRFGNPYALIGHSAGGNAATRVRSPGYPWRLGFNAYHGRDGRRTMNFESKKDWVPGGRYILVHGTGGHGTGGFQGKMTRLTRSSDWYKMNHKYIARCCCQPRLKSRPRPSPPRQTRPRRQCWRMPSVESNSKDDIEMLDEEKLVEMTKKVSMQEMNLSPDAASIKAMTDAHWRWVRGHLTNVAIAATGAIYGVNRHQLIYTRRRWNHGPWYQIPGHLKEISVSVNGRVVAGVNRHQSIFYRLGAWSGNLRGTRWVHHGGRLNDITVGRRTYGVTSHQFIYTKYHGSRNWCRVPGRLKQISAHGNRVVGVNVHNSIYQYMGFGRWRGFPGRAKWASMGADGDFWVINSGNHIFRWNYRNRRWYRVWGCLKQIDVANRHNIIGVNRHDQIFAYV